VEVGLVQTVKLGKNKFPTFNRLGMGVC